MGSGSIHSYQEEKLTMRKLLSALALGGALLAVGAGGTLAANMNQTVMLHPPMHTSMMAIAHANGTAHLMYTTNDVSFSLSVKRLPAPKAVHASVYMVWLVKGSHKVLAGHFTKHTGVVFHSAMIMDTTFNKLVVTGEKSMTRATPMGPTVLSGTVMHH
jgi:hypothetical protein